MTPLTYIEFLKRKIPQAEVAGFEPVKPLLEGKPIYIYGLKDPETRLIRYIGKSDNPHSRLFGHLKDKSNCHRVHWIQGLVAKGLKPEVVIIEEIIGDWPWQESERHWIAYGREHGWDLTNNTDGGDGVCGLPAETRERMRKTWLGRKHKPESLSRIGAAARGRKHTAKHKERMSKLMSGRKITWVAKVAASLRRITPEQGEAIKTRLQAGEMVKDLAAEFKVDRTTISKIKAGKYFRNYEEEALNYPEYLKLNPPIGSVEITSGISLSAETMRGLRRHSTAATWSANLALAMAPFEPEAERIAADNVREYERYSQPFGRMALL